MSDARLVFFIYAEMLDTSKSSIIVLENVEAAQEADNIRSLGVNFSKRKVQCDKGEGQLDTEIYIVLRR